METIESKSDGVLEISIVGHLDTASSQPFEERLRKLIEDGERQILLECSQMEYVNSSGLKAVLIGAKMLETEGGKLVLCGLLPNVHMIFEMIGFTRILAIVPGREEARQRFAANGAPA